MTIHNEQRGAAERLLALTLDSGAHLWHNRPGLDVGGVWQPATRRARVQFGLRVSQMRESTRRHWARQARQQPRQSAQLVQPGLFVPAAVNLYGQLLSIYELDAELAARFASYALTQTDWRDLKVCCAALMLVQPRSGAPVHDDDGSVAFYDDDYRAVGEAMVLHYEQGSTKMMTPKAVLRIGELLGVPDIAELNRAAGFADAAGRKPPLGRWPSAVRQWLAYRERNLPLLEGLVAAGYKETIKALARRSGYRPTTARFFEVLGWPQRQASGGHRRVGLDGLDLARRDRFDGLTEEQICERIVTEKLSYKDAVGRLPSGIGLTPAIMVALLPSLSDRDLRILSPTLESLGLLADAEIRQRWEQALRTATDQRSLHIAGNLRSRELRDKLKEAAEAAVTTAVSETVGDEDVHVMFLIDKSASMEGAIQASKQVLTRILAGFPAERLHIATFDTVGRVLRPKATTRVAVQHMLSDVKAGGGTTHRAALHALSRAGVRMPAGATLIVIVVGDEAGEDGQKFVKLSITDYRD
jgi:hypothetical protein